MITVRTCGLGTFHNDERLKLLKKNVKYFIEDPYSKIFKLHDHKGDLTVYWYSVPKKEDIETINNLWLLFEPSDVDHFEINIMEVQIPI